MTRGLDAAQKTAVAAETVIPIYLAELDFASGFVRVTTAPFSITFESNTYLGVGDVGGISKIEETIEGRAHRVTLTLVGVKNSYISIALDEDYQGRDAKIWKAYLDTSYAIISAPIAAFWGIMDVMVIKRGPETAQIDLQIVSRFAKWERAPDSPRWSNEDHQKRFPGDKFFEFMPQITAGKEVIWGKG